MFVYMDEWGWQGYNLLQTACGQRRGGRDSDTERERGDGEVRTSKEKMSWQEKNADQHMKKTERAR